jgi:hypothetical protein
VRHDFEARLFALPKARFHGRDGVPPVRVARDVLVDTLDAHLDARAAVREHLLEVARVAEVGPRLDREADALAPAVLAVRDLQECCFRCGTAGHAAGALQATVLRLTSSASDGGGAAVRFGAIVASEGSKAAQR